jgi:hypothetical protein
MPSLTGQSQAKGFSKLGKPVNQRSPTRIQIMEQSNKPDPYEPKGGKLSQWGWFLGLSLGGLLFVLIIAKLLHLLMFSQIDT